jgi:hypothetical protein
MVSERHLGTVGRAFKAPIHATRRRCSLGTPLWTAAEVAQYGRFNCSRDPGVAEFY